MMRVVAAAAADRAAPAAMRGDLSGLFIVISF
jgi:hypothetical protein